MFAGVIERAKKGKQRLEVVVGRLLGKLLAHTSVGHGKTPIFIVGCQRSGTTMLQKVLRRSPQIQVYGEDSKKAFGEGVRVRSEDTLRFLIYLSREPIVVFKPLNDTQNTDNLLKIHPNAKAIWMYRQFHDVVNSLVEKWGDGQKVHVDEISTGNYTRLGSRSLGERVSPTNLALVKKLRAKNLSAHDAAAIIWFLRNTIYFDLELDANPNVLLCNYEELVTDPAWHFRRVFNFMGCELSSTYFADVFSSSILKREASVIDAEIVRLCEGLMNRMNEQYRLQLGFDQANTSFVGSR